MQGKELSEQVTTVKSSAGIDVSKDWLDAHVLPQAATLRVPNTREGVKKLKRWLARFDIALIVVEATGKWHRQVQRSLIADGLMVAVVDPFRVRAFAEASGILAKTDRLDAYVLAAFAATMNPTIRPPAPEVLEELGELITARESAVAEQTALKNQLAAAVSRFLKHQLERRCARIAKDIEALEREIESRIRADQGLAQRYDILISIPSFGPVVVPTLIACLAELGTCSRKQISLLAGVAPIANQSGQRDGVRTIKGGRAKVRRVLYLAALSAKVHNPDMKILHDRLDAKGKEAKVILTAIARKLVVLANTLIAEGRKWQPMAPKNA
jgi:transposase